MVSEKINQRDTNTCPLPSFCPSCKRISVSRSDKCTRQINIWAHFPGLVCPYDSNYSWSYPPLHAIGIDRFWNKYLPDRAPWRKSPYKCVCTRSRLCFLWDAAGEKRVKLTLSQWQIFKGIIRERVFAFTGLACFSAYRGFFPPLRCAVHRYWP